MWVTQIAQRVSDEALAVLPKEDILRVFPKKVKTAKSSLILKAPKTEGSVRKQYLTGPLMEEIKRRLAEIESNKEFFGSDYQDYGLLICNADGAPSNRKPWKSSLRRCSVKWDLRIRFSFRASANRDRCTKYA